MIAHHDSITASVVLKAQTKRNGLAGPSQLTSEKLKIFDTYWDYADRKFAAYQNLVVDWPALRQKYRAEVAAGVSRARRLGAGETAPAGRSVPREVTWTSRFRRGGWRI